MTLLFGYHMPSFTFPGVPDEQLFDRVVELARAAEDAGFGLVTVMDHVYQIRGTGPETDPMLEGWSTLAALAASTRSIRLGTLVTGVTYRNPALLAKTATTLDVISGGRAIFGIGAAWNEDEHAAYGFAFPPIAERMDRLDEALTIARLMFTEERPSYEGRNYRIERALNNPRPIQVGGPRILVGGGGETRTLKIAAKHADMTHWFSLPLEELIRKSSVLERHCEAIGRDPATITRTFSSPVVVAATMREAEATLAALPPDRRGRSVAATPEHAAELLRPYFDAGFGGVTFRNPTLPTPDAIAAVGDLIRMLA